MELHADKRPASADRRITLGILSLAEDTGVVFGLDIVRVDEVEERIVGQFAKDGMLLLDGDLIPADVRNVHALGEAHDAAFKQSQPAVDAEFVALFKKHLQSDAEPDDW